MAKKASQKATTVAKSASPKAMAKGKESKVKAPRAAVTSSKKAIAVLSKAPTPVAKTGDDDSDEDEADAQGTSTGGAGADLQASLTAENAAATPMSLKNYRNHPDMENFFRFIYENDLRIEALHIIDEVLASRPAKKGAKKNERELS